MNYCCESFEEWYKGGQTVSYSQTHNMFYMFVNTDFPKMKIIKFCPFCGAKLE